MEIVQVNSIKAWLLAARPKTLAGAARQRWNNYWEILPKPLRFYWDVPWPMQTAASK